MKQVRFLKRKKAPSNPWEANFGRIITPLERFIKNETNSGLLLVACTIIALFIANSSFHETYINILRDYFGFGTEKLHFKMSIHHWINDGLMALFFFLIGLEIKREVLVGELSDPKQALLPVCAAIGGMLFPALVYYVLNPSGDGQAGWGIPMATDIAFSIAVLVLLGNRVPKALMTFLVALAIVDDMGAVLVIALFYTSDISWINLLYAFLFLGLLFIFNLSGVKKTYPYAILGLFVWYFMYQSGVHATIAGILTALMIPSRPKYKPKEFSSSARTLLDRFDVHANKEEDTLRNSKMSAVLSTLERGIERTQTPLQHMEHRLHQPVNFFIIPLFALANAGVPVDLNTIDKVLVDPITMGVILGLFVGKPIGICLVSWLAVKLGVCQLPKGVTFGHIFGAGILAGIGFTMSIFIAELAFGGQQEVLNHAKMGILIASFLAAVIGFIYLWILGSKKTPTSTIN